MADEYRIVGPPGTGKTQFVRNQVEAWVDRGEYAASDIVLTSFTRSAAAVLSGRVPVPRENIATLHALAYRALGKPPMAEEGDLARQWNEAHATRPSWQVGSPVSNEDDGLALPDSETGEMMRLYSLARSRLVPVHHPLFLQTRDFAVEWNRFKADNAAVDFNDMLEEACMQFPSLGLPVLVVDEAQDLTPLHWTLARQWGQQAQVFMVAGDAAQLLYNFAGAEPEQFLAPLPEGHVRTLSRSYRLPSKVLEVAEGLLRRHSGSMMEGREYRPREAREHPDDVGVVRYSDATWRQPEEILASIERDERDCMVIASCSFMLQPLIKLLREHGIPFANRYKTSNGAWNPLARRSGTTSTAAMIAAFADGAPAVEWVDLLRANSFIVKQAKDYLEAGSDTMEGLLKAEHVEAYKAKDLRWLRERMLQKYVGPADYAISVITKHGTAALVREPKVTLGTIHSVKGGENRIVYVFPDVSYAGDQERQNSREGEDAAVRLAYVALTRASEELVLCAPADARRSMW